MGDAFASTSRSEIDPEISPLVSGLVHRWRKPRDQDARVRRPAQGWRPATVAAPQPETDSDSRDEARLRLLARGGEERVDWFVEETAKPV